MHVLHCASCKYCFKALLSMTAIFNSIDNTAMGFATQWGRGGRVHCFYLSKGLSNPLQDRVRHKCNLDSLATWTNRPFPRPKTLHFQNEGTTFLAKMSFICIRIKTHSHTKSCTLSLALKLRLWATRNGLSAIPAIGGPLAVNNEVTCISQPSAAGVFSGLTQLRMSTLRAVIKAPSQKP